MPDVVAVEGVGVAAHRLQLLLDQVGDGRFAGAGEAGEPEHRRSLAFGGRAALLGDVERLPVDVLRAAQREMDHAGPHSAVADPVDDDEAAGVVIVGVGIKRDRLIETDIAQANLVQLELLGRQMLERVDVDLVLELGDRRRDGLGAGLQPVRPAGQQRLSRHPDDGGFELVGDLWRIAGGGQHVAA